MKPWLRKKIFAVMVAIGKLLAVARTVSNHIIIQSQRLNKKAGSSSGGFDTRKVSL